MEDDGFGVVVDDDFLWNVDGRGSDMEDDGVDDDFLWGDVGRGSVMEDDGFGVVVVDDLLWDVVGFGSVVEDVDVGVVVEGFLRLVDFLAVAGEFLAC